jgi:hypothetical protein
MSIPVFEAMPGVRATSVIADAPNWRHLPAIGAAVAHGARTAVLLLLGVASMASSMVFLASVGILMPIVTDQVGGWLQTGQWQRAPIVKLLTQMGYPPQFEAGAIAPVANWCLSGESVLLIALTAAGFALSVRMLEAARRPRSRRR